MDTAERNASRGFTGSVTFRGSSEPPTLIGFTTVQTHRTLQIACHGTLTNVDISTSGRVGRTPVEFIEKLYLSVDADLVLELDGTFALALYDPHDHRLLLARDRLGIARLYYSVGTSEIAFSTQLRDVPVDERRLDIGSVNQYLAFGLVPGPRTIMDGIDRVLPGCIIDVHNATIRSRQYWDIEWSEAGPGGATARALQSCLEPIYRDIARTASEEHPLGILCSGGIDSSVNLVMLQQTYAPCVALTAGFAAAEYDERSPAGELARHLDVEHHSRLVDEGDLPRIAALVHSYQEPIADQAALPTFALLASAAESLQCIVSGEGGDELWGPPRRWQPTAQLTRTIADRAAIARQYMQMIACCDDLERVELLEAAHRPDAVLTEPFEMLHELYRRCNSTNLFQLLKYGQMKTWFTSGVVEKDRSVSAALGLECFFPLADARAARLVFGLDPTEHQRLCTDKQWLRQLLYPRLPVPMVDRPKHRFLVPFERWQGDRSVAFVRECLAHRDAVCRSFLSTPAIDRCIAAWVDGNAQRGRQLWAILVLELWLRDVSPIAT